MSDDEGREGERAAEIIRLFPEADEHDAQQPVTRASGSKIRCSHRRTQLTINGARRVVCECGEEVDPVDVMIGWAGDWDHLVRWRREAERRARLAHERLQEILRLEKNARALLKRLDPDEALEAPQAPWGAGSII